MKIHRIAGCFLLAGAFLLSTGIPAAACGQAENGVGAQMVVTALAKGSRPTPVLQQDQVTVTLNNKPAQIANWTALRGPDAGLQLVFLFDESLPAYVSLQFPSLRKFIQALPPTAQVAVAYMSNGRASMAQTLTADHALAAKSLRLPNSIPGISASPYFCLSDLAKRWPSRAHTRRVVFMVTNGEDPYYRSRDMQDPYVRAAITDSQKAGLLVYSIYFRDTGSRGFGSLGVLFGQSYLLKVAQETGGQAYTEAMTTPVSFDPFLKQFQTSLDNQYRVKMVPDGTGNRSVKIKSSVPDIKLAFPSTVYIGMPF